MPDPRLNILRSLTFAVDALEAGHVEADARAAELSLNLVRQILHDVRWYDALAAQLRRVAVCDLARVPRELRPLLTVLQEQMLDIGMIVLPSSTLTDKKGTND